ncbi:hypothetical protein K440DRAFT_630875 [Wilcoxina mikolae CBS 423.85]|nr:hypothetical protein K440DRAFT_630875 [Wilcoxina mikolae CBS 423.85]
MTKRPDTKYFREPGRSDLTGHYDIRYVPILYFDSLGGSFPETVLIGLVQIFQPSCRL